jgi:hypothetical protein
MSSYSPNLITHKGQKQSVNACETTNLASSAKTLYETHADRAFLSKFVMHNKQALSNYFFLRRCDSQLYLRRSKLDSALAMHSFMCLSYPHMYVRWREERFGILGDLRNFHRGNH